MVRRALKLKVRGQGQGQDAVGLTPILDLEDSFHAVFIFAFIVVYHFILSENSENSSVFSLCIITIIWHRFANGNFSLFDMEVVRYVEFLKRKSVGAPGN